MSALSQRHARPPARPAPARADPRPRVDAQRLRVLRRHAHEGRPRAGRDRAAAVRGRRPGTRRRSSRPAERAALALTDALTLLPGNPLPDDVVADGRGASSAPTASPARPGSSSRSTPGTASRSPATSRPASTSPRRPPRERRRAARAARPRRPADPPQRLGRRDGPRRRGGRLPRRRDDEQRRRRVARLRGRGGDPGGRDARRGRRGSPASSTCPSPPTSRAATGSSPPTSRSGTVAAGAAGLNFEDTDHAHAPRAARHRGPGRSGSPRSRRPRTSSSTPGSTSSSTAAPVADGLERARAYADAGADCVYPIGITDEATIAAFVELGTPVNVVLLTGRAADRAAGRARRRADQPRPLPPRRDARRARRAPGRPQPPRYAFVIGIRRSRPNARGVILIPGGAWRRLYSARSTSAKTRVDGLVAAARRARAARGPASSST